MKIDRLKKRGHYQIPPWVLPECEDIMRRLLFVGLVDNNGRCTYLVTISYSYPIVSTIKTCDS